MFIVVFLAKYNYIMKFNLKLLETADQGPVSLRLVIPQFKDIISHTQKQFGGVCFKILCEISKSTFEISHQSLNPCTAKYAFYEVLKNWRIMIS